MSTGLNGWAHAQSLSASTPSATATCRSSTSLHTVTRSLVFILTSYCSMAMPTNTHKNKLGTSTGTKLLATTDTLVEAVITQVMKQVDKCMTTALAPHGSSTTLAAPGTNRPSTSTAGKAHTCIMRQAGQPWCHLHQSATEVGGSTVVTSHGGECLGRPA